MILPKMVTPAGMDTPLSESATVFVAVMLEKSASATMVMAEKSPVVGVVSVTTLKPFCPKLCRFACDWFANVAICFLFLG